MKEYTRSTVDRKHIEDKLPASSRTNQAIKYSWQNYTNVKCRFLFAFSAVKRICFPQEHIQLTVVFFRFHLYSCATCRKYFLQDFSLKINHSRFSLKFKLSTIQQIVQTIIFVILIVKSVTQLFPLDSGHFFDVLLARPNRWSESIHLQFICYDTIMCIVMAINQYI